MSLLRDAMLDAFEGASPAPSSDRQRLLVSAGFGLIGLAISGWLFMVSGDPLNEPRWGFHAVVWTVVMGGGGVVLSLWHLIRYRSEPVAAVTCLAINIAAFIVPCVRLLT